MLYHRYFSYRAPLPHLVYLLPNMANRPVSAAYYRVLGLRTTATPTEIKCAYHKLAKVYHPDRNSPSAAGDATARFKELQTAYEVLSDPDLRYMYDHMLQFLEMEGYGQYDGMVEQLDVEDYLNKFQELTLTTSGLGLSVQSFNRSRTAMLPTAA